MRLRKTKLAAGFLVVMMIASMAAGGCALKSGADARGSGYYEGEAWEPKPTALRIYPSTRFTTRENEEVLDARVELFDQMGDSVKGSGHFTFELVEDAGAAGRGTQLYVWDAEVYTLEAQRKFYDPISQGYLFRLKMDDNEIAKRGAILRVTFLPIDGERLDAQQTLRSR